MRVFGLPYLPEKIASRLMSGLEVAGGAREEVQVAARACGPVVVRPVQTLSTGCSCGQVHSDRHKAELASSNFRRLILGCMDSYDSEQRRVLQN